MRGIENERIVKIGVACNYINANVSRNRQPRPICSINFKNILAERNNMYLCMETFKRYE